MKINIYYGGRGMVDDPTVYAMNIMQGVLEELHVVVERFNLHELKGNITTLPQTLKEADGIILAATVEWYGIGGYMHQFLDACWLYGDKEKISQIYMCPVVMSTTYGEREGKLTLSVGWEILGGRPCSGICGYITDTKNLVENAAYTNIIEKKAENMYRTISQKLASFPASNQAVKDMVSITSNISLTPQESDQLSQYVADEGYVQQQKTDIAELTDYFKGILGEQNVTDAKPFVTEFEKAFIPQPGVKATYRINIKDKKTPFVLKIKQATLECFYGSEDGFDVDIQATTETLIEIVSGRMTFQRAFMGGSIKVKGDFKLLRNLDQLFVF